MQAGSHLLTNLALAVVVENLVPIAGSSLHWSELTQVMMQPGSTLAPSAMIAKGAYYTCVVAAASLPDLDQRLRLFPHRTFTHSLVGIICLASTLLGLRALIFAVLAMQHIAMLPEEQRFSQVVLIALPLACCFHILGDLITIRGVALFWPKAMDVRLVPKKWSIKNQSWSEYLVVAFLFAAVGLGIAFNILGV